MARLTLIVIFFFLPAFAYTQQTVLLFKKKNKEIGRYWQGTIIAFQLKDGQWQKGKLTRIQNDSIYVRPHIVRYNFWGIDTIHFPVVGYSFQDVYAMPNKGILIDNKDGRNRISRSGGHLHWYWVKSGWIFRVGAAGYAGLNITNGLIKNNLSISENKKQLGAAAAIFLGGIFLHKAYKPNLRLGKKYHFTILNFSN